MIGLWSGIAAVLAIGWMATTWVLVAKLKQEEERVMDHFNRKMEVLRENNKLKKELAIYKEKEKEKKSLTNKIKALTDPKNLFKYTNNKEAE